MKARYVVPVKACLLAFAPPAEADAGISCLVRATELSGAVHLEAVVSGKTALAGEYQFEVRKSGGGGSANISQGGTFESGPGQQTVLSEVTLGGGGHATAELSITRTGRKTCTARYPATRHG